MTEGPDRPGTGDEGRGAARDPAPGSGPPPGYGPAQAPRPGIVPLRPLGLDDVLGGGFRFVRSHPAVALAPAAVVMLIVGPLQFAAQAAIAPAPGEPLPGFVDLMVDSLLPALPLALVGLLVYPPMLAVHFSALVPAVVGRKLSLGEAWTVARPCLGRTYGVYAVFALVGVVVLGVGFGVALLIGQAGGGIAILVAVLVVIAAYVGWIYLAVMLFPAVPATVVEGLGVRAALERSRALVRGSWWRFFGYQLVAGLIAAVASLVAIIPASIAGALTAVASSDSLTSTGTLPVSFYAIMTVALVVAGAVLIPFVVGVLGLLYVDQRIRRERYDQQLVAQAGPQA